MTDDKISSPKYCDSNICDENILSKFRPRFQLRHGNFRPNIQLQQHDYDSIYFTFIQNKEPNSVTITPKLNGSNYLAWSLSMQCALDAKNELSFVNSSTPIPDQLDFNRGVLERCNHLIHYWID